MHDNAENISNAISSAATSKATAGIGATITATTVVATAKDPQLLGNFLATNGPNLFFNSPALSYVEIFQIVGSIFVTYQLIKLTASGVKNLIAQSIRFYNFCRGFRRKPLKIKSKGATHANSSKS